jgi:hypothetical protein
MRARNSVLVEAFGSTQLRGIAQPTTIGMAQIMR